MSKTWTRRETACLGNPKLVQYFLSGKRDSSRNKTGEIDKDDIKMTLHTTEKFYF